MLRSLSSLCLCFSIICLFLSSLFLNLREDPCSSVFFKQTLTLLDQSREKVYPRSGLTIANSQLAHLRFEYRSVRALVRGIMHVVFGLLRCLAHLLSAMLRRDS